MDKNTIKKLLDLSQMLLEFDKLEEAIPKASEEIKKLINADRITIFIYSQPTNMVWTYLADGVEKLILPADKGIVGYVIKNKTIKKVNDTSKEPLFYKEVDENTGYETKNILSVPLLNNENKVIGVIQLLNKEGGFTKDDINIAYLFSNYLSAPLEILLQKHHSLKIKDNDDYFI